MEPDVSEATKGKADGEKRKMRKHVLPIGHFKECCVGIMKFIPQMSIEYEIEKGDGVKEFTEIRGKCPVCGNLIISTDLEEVTAIQVLTS